MGAVLLLGLLWPASITQAAGASLTFSPNQGSYIVDNTFDISIVVNTGDQAINAVEAYVSFPPDKLQVVSPTVSNSFIQIWTAGPSYSNTDGTLTFQGGLPQPGITTSAGIISTVRFRAKSAGTATLKFTDKSRVLANDGKGTNILTSRSNSTIEIKLAPPDGPIVSSTSHEDQNKWYSNRNVVLQWEPVGGASGYSFAFDSSAVTTPEEKVKTTDTTTTQTATTDGIWYFHIKAGGVSGSWSGTTHFAARVDTTPPASFKPHLDQTTFAADTRPVVSFVTTDAASGIDHYAVKIINKNDTSDAVTLFVEQSSPYQLPKLDPGRYSVVVKAYDAAGNTTDGATDFTVVKAIGPLSRLLGGGLIQTLALTFLGFIILLGLWLLLRRRQRRTTLAKVNQDLADLKQLVAKRKSELQELVATQAQTETELRTTSQPASREASRKQPSILP